MKPLAKSGIVFVVWVSLVFTQSNTIDQLVGSFPSTNITGTGWIVYDHADPLTRWTDESDAAALTMAFGSGIFWSCDAGLNYPPPVPVAGDTLGVIGSYDPEYAASPGTYGDNAGHIGYYWLYSETLTSGTDNHWMADTCRPLPAPSVAQGAGDSVEISIDNADETRYAGQTSYDVLGFDLWCDTTGTGTPNSYDLYIGFFPVQGGAGDYSLLKYHPSDHYTQGGTVQVYHAYYLVAAPGFTTDADSGHSTYYLSENSNLAEISVGIAEQKETTPTRMSLTTAPSITRNRAAINYALTKTTAVTITMYNATGQVVRRLVDGVQAAGEHTVMFDGTEMPSGVYFCQLVTPDMELKAQLTVLR